jgi:hypothetical protein
MEALSLRAGPVTVRLCEQIAVLVTALVLICLGMVADGQAADDSDHDIRQTARARQALMRDPALAPLNLGIRVRNRVATLWGPVPTAELGFRAERILRSLFEIAEVHNDLEVSGHAATPVVEPVVAPAAPSFLPAQLPPALPPRSPSPHVHPAPTAPSVPAPRAVELPTIEVHLQTIELPSNAPLPARMPVGPNAK